MQLSYGYSNINFADIEKYIVEKIDHDGIKLYLGKRVYGKKRIDTIEFLGIENKLSSKKKFVNKYLGKLKGKYFFGKNTVPYKNHIEYIEGNLFKVSL